jgi:hypothetical protein
VGKVLLAFFALDGNVHHLKRRHTNERTSGSKEMQIR